MSNKGRTVVILNPRISWQQTLRRLFLRAGYDVVGIASDGATALALVSHIKPDLVTIDGDLLAGEQALEVAAAIRSHNPTVAIIIVGDGDLKFEGRGFKKDNLGNGESLLKLAAQALA